MELIRQACTSVNLRKFVDFDLKTCGSYLDQYESVQLGDGGDTVLHLILRHLYQGTVGLLLHHGVHAIPSNPGIGLREKRKISTFSRRLFINVVYDQLFNFLIFKF